MSTRVKQLTALEDGTYEVVFDDGSRSVCSVDERAGAPIVGFDPNPFVSGVYTGDPRLVSAAVAAMHRVRTAAV